MVAPAWCEKYIGVPYDNRGRTIQGVDCWGLAMVVERAEHNVVIPDYNVYYTTRRDAEDVGEQLVAERDAGLWLEIDDGEQKCFDLVLLRSMGFPIHVGVVVDHEWMLHIEKGVDSCLEKYNGLIWRNRNMGFYRYVG